MAKLTVDVGVNNTAFRQGLDAMRSQAQGWSKQMVGILGGAFAAGSMINWARQFMAEMGRIDDLSQRLGETTDTIQRIGEAAHFAGADIEMVVKSMSKLTVEASKGSDKFAALGISAEAFANADLESKVLMLATAYQQANGDQGKMIALMDLLGNKAQDLIPLLAQGPDALADAFAAASVVSAEAIAGITAFEDALDKSLMTIKAWVGNAVAGFQKFGAAVSLAFSIIKGDIDIPEAERIFKQFNEDQKQAAASRVNKGAAAGVESPEDKRAQDAEQRAIDTQAERLEERILQRKLQQMEVEDRIFELQQMQIELQTKMLNSMGMSNLEKLKIAEQLLDVEEQIATAQAEKDANDKRKAEEEAAEAEKQRKAEEEAAKKAEEDTPKTIEEAKKQAGVISSSLASIGGGGGSYIAMSNEARELQNQTQLLRQLVNNTSPQTQRLSKSQPADAF